MDIDKMIQGLDAYFENTPKEHFEEVWKDVEKYENIVSMLMITCVSFSLSEKTLSFFSLKTLQPLRIIFYSLLAIF